MFLTCCFLIFFFRNNLDEVRSHEFTLTTVTDVRFSCWDLPEKLIGFHPLLWEELLPCYFIFHFKLTKLQKKVSFLIFDTDKNLLPSNFCRG
jgi:hypothetical protein